jgi:hypothetical protein
MYIFQKPTSATQLWRGRLHVMGGSKEIHQALGVDHWSIAIKDGNALEKEWLSEVPVPVEGHRSAFCPHLCLKLGSRFCFDD